LRHPPSEQRQVARVQMEQRQVARMQMEQRQVARVQMERLPAAWAQARQRAGLRRPQREAEQPARSHRR